MLQQASRYAMTAFWFAQLLALIGEAIDLRTLLAKQADLVKKVRAAAPGSDDAKAAKIELLKLKTQLLWGFAGIASRLGNLTYSANGWRLTEKVLGSQFSEKTCAYAGLMSGVLALAKTVHGHATK